MFKIHQERNILMRWDESRHKYNLIQLKLFANFLRSSKMAQVNRIKTPAKDTNTPIIPRHATSPVTPRHAALPLIPRYAAPPVIPRHEVPRNLLRRPFTSFGVTSQVLSCPFPIAMNFVVVSSSSPIGPKA